MKKIAIIGNEETNFGPWLDMVSAGLSELEIDVEAEAISIDSEDLSGWIESDLRVDFVGAIVCEPHKEKIGLLVDEFSESATKVGAVNTLIIKDGKITAANTEALGVLKSILTAVDPNEKNVVVIGDNALARATVFACQSAGANVFLQTNDERKSVALVEKFSIPIWDDRAEDADADIVVRTNDMSIKDIELLNIKLAVELASENFETPASILADAQDTNFVPLDLFMARSLQDQFQLWFQKYPEVEVLEEAYLG